MKTNKLLLFLAFVVSMLFISNVNAATYNARITGTDVSLRARPNIKSTLLGYMQKNEIYPMVSTDLYNTEGGCLSGKWYKIIKGSSTGYVCSSYVQVVSNNTTPTTACEKDLAAKGFDSSYWAGLCALKNAHPKWDFQPLNTGLEWNVAVSKESICGINLVQSTDASMIDKNCRNWGSGGFVPPSAKAVSYYMDPRNFFSEKYIFQFETLKYQASFGDANYKTAVNSILSGVPFYTSNGGTSFATIISDNTKNAGLSPVYMSAKMLQELGRSTSLINLYGGKYTGYNNKYFNYFNFVNFGVSDGCVSQSGTTYCGLEYAHKFGWYGKDKSINGASSQIAANYVNVGQHTGYLQKYNVKPNNPSATYTHQYMSNVAGAASEAISNYTAYSKLGVLNSSFIFYIPIYKNMANTDYDTSGGSSSGGGSAGGGTTTTSIDTIITRSGYRSSGSILQGIASGTSVSTVISSIQAIGGSGSVYITKSNGASVNSGIIATGFKVKVTNKSSSKTYTVVINGDSSGDGYITALDLLQVQKSILNTYSMGSNQGYAADTNNDGYITALDLLQVQKQILGTYKIVQ